MQIHFKMQLKLLYKTIGKRYKECLKTMVFLLEFLLEEKKDARLKGSKVNGLEDGIEKKMEE